MNIERRDPHALRQSPGEGASGFDVGFVGLVFHAVPDPEVGSELLRDVLMVTHVHQIHKQSRWQIIIVRQEAVHPKFHCPGVFDSCEAGDALCGPVVHAVEVQPMVGR